MYNQESSTLAVAQCDVVSRADENSSCSRKQQPN